MNCARKAGIHAAAPMIRSGLNLLMPDEAGLASHRRRQIRSAISKVVAVTISVSLATVTTANVVSAQQQSLPSNLTVQAADSKSEIEALLNPFGDPWSFRRTNPDIPIISSLSCYRKLPERFVRPTLEQKIFLRKLGETIIFGECSPVMDGPDQATRKAKPHELKQIIADIKLHEPKIKYLGYFPLAEFNNAIPGSSVVRKHKDWFVRQRDSSELLRDRRGGLVLDITNPEYQDFIAERIRNSLSIYDMDGFLADNVTSLPRRPSDPQLAPEEIERSWAGAWRSILGKVKNAIGPDKMIIANVQRKEIGLASAILDVADGVMLEDPFGPMKADLEVAGRKDRFEHVYRAAAARNKYVITVVNTNVNGTKFETTSSAAEHRFARYYLAAYLVFRLHDKNILQYYTPNVLGSQFNSQPFFTDWNLRVGTPLGRYQTPAAGVYRRNFSHATVYLNNSMTPFQVEFGACCAKFTPEGELVTRYTVLQKTGMFFLDSLVESAPR